MGEGMLDELREQWIAACMVFDDQAANRMLDQAFAIAAPETICTEVLQKGLAQIGEGWYAGSISVQQEHFASAIAIRRINNLLAALHRPPDQGTSWQPARQVKSMTSSCCWSPTCSEEMAGMWFIWEPMYHSMIWMQPSNPQNQSLILSAAQTLDSAASLRKMSEYLLSQDVPLAFGGRSI